MSNFKSEESAFNFAIEYLKEISISLKMCKMNSTQGNIDGWVQWLRAAYRELACKTKDIEDEEFNDDFKSIYRLMNNPKDKMRRKNEILFMLDQLEIKLRKRLQKKGMLLPSKDDPKYAVLQR